jgi:hypothetical protein
MQVFIFTVEREGAGVGFIHCFVSRSRHVDLRLLTVSVLYVQTPVTTKYQYVKFPNLLLVPLKS